MPPENRINPLAALFNKFAGKEVSMTYASSAPVCAPNPSDPTLLEMRKLADDNGLSLRVWFPDTAGTMDYKTNRVNAHIEKGADGKYRVSNRFDIG